MQRWQPTLTLQRDADGRPGEYFLAAVLPSPCRLTQHANFLAIARALRRLPATPAGPVVLRRGGSSFLLVHESDRAALNTAEALQRQLEVQPVLDPTLLAELQAQAATRAWRALSLPLRARLCLRSGLNLVSAVMPECPPALYERLGPH